jgi:hypothetical protein
MNHHLKLAAEDIKCNEHDGISDNDALCYGSYHTKRIRWQAG